MFSIRFSAIEALRSQLMTATLHTPDSLGYEESLVRWSDTGIKHAVGKNSVQSKHLTDENNREL